MDDKTALYRVLKYLPADRIGPVLSEALNQLDASGLKVDEPVVNEEDYRKMISDMLPRVPGKNIDLVHHLVAYLAE
jgi:hypothetical protein